MTALSGRKWAAGFPSLRIAFTWSVALPKRAGVRRNNTWQNYRTDAKTAPLLQQIAPIQWLRYTVNIFGRRPPPLKFRGKTNGLSVTVADNRWSLWWIVGRRWACLGQRRRYGMKSGVECLMSNAELCKRGTCKVSCEVSLRSAVLEFFFIII